MYTIEERKQPEGVVDDPRWAQIQKLYNEALGRPPEERTRFLERQRGSLHFLSSAVKNSQQQSIEL